MSLPIRTTLIDVEAICNYLLTKPTGASLAEAKAVLDEKVLDTRKVVAFKTWGLVEDNGGGKLRLTERGRMISKDKGARKAAALRETIASVKPYFAVIERAVHRGETVVTATEVAAYWHQYFKADASDSDKILNDQAVCFFQIAEGADLGNLTVGRHGQPTRFEFAIENARAFAEGGEYVERAQDDGADGDEEHDHEREADERERDGGTPDSGAQRGTPPDRGNRVFITHGKNKKILEQVKEIVAYGKFEPVVAQERETAAKPVPEKVMDEMRRCRAAVIHVAVDSVLFDADGKEVPQINGNVLIEIGAAMALYGRNFILLVEEGVKLPSNLQGLYECRYTGDELSATATMKLLKAFNEFT